MTVSTGASVNSAVTSVFVNALTPIPSIIVNPSQGPADTAATATLTGFPAYVAIIITFDGDNVGTITSTTGNGSVRITVPNVSLGIYNVTAIGAQGGVATTTFDVTQAATPSPTPHQQ